MRNLKTVRKTGISFFILVLILISCRHVEKPVSNEQAPDENNLVNLNKVLIKKDRQSIIGYLKRHHVEMNETTTGLWYTITKPGTGPRVESNKVITLAYEVKLLDGTLCYSSDNDGLKTFLVGKGNVESGLEEGILLLHVGDKARFLIPPHLAHGHTGDDNKIPPRAILDYRVEVLNILEK